MVNVLIDFGVITQDDAKSLHSDDPLSGAIMLKRVENMQNVLDCTLVQDYDADRVNNHQDMCPYTYDPKQSNTDGDAW